MVIPVQKFNSEPTESGIYNSSLTEEITLNPQEDDIMTRYFKLILGIAVGVAIGLAAGWAQQTMPMPPGHVMAPASKIEGQVIKLQHVPAQAASIWLTVKTSDGKEQIVHVSGPLDKVQPTGFNPKVGDKIAATGEVCGIFHSNQITSAGKVYRTPPMAMPTD